MADHEKQEVGDVAHLLLLLAFRCFGYISLCRLWCVHSFRNARFCVARRLWSVAVPVMYRSDGRD